MTHPRSTSKWAALLAIPVLSGCAAPAARVPEATTAIEPLRTPDVHGTLVVRVDGHPRDIEYFINGIHIDPEEEIEWWNEARLQVQLRPGFYRVEAGFRVRGFAGEENVYRIATSQPVEVRAGGVTRLLAELDKNFRGVPRSKLTLFREVTEEVPAKPATDTSAHAGEAPHPAPSKAAGTAVVNPPGVPEALDTHEAPDAPHVLVLRGGEHGVRIESADGGPEMRVSGGTIVIRGTEVSVEGSAASIASTEPIGLPAVVDLHEEDLAPPSEVEVAVIEAPAIASSSPLLTVLLRSEPSAARVRVNDRDVGTTPVRVRLDPTVDHVVYFEHADCDHVQLLRAASWERGRSSTIAVKMDCP
jgi:hypothetical protein